MTRIGEELNRKSIGPKLLAAFLGVSEKTAWNKMNGITEFSVSEALKTKHGLLPEFDLEYLFADIEEAPDIKQ